MAGKPSCNEAQIALIHQLLLTSSVRKVSKVVGVSRGTVTKIASGDYQSREQAKKKSGGSSAEDIFWSRDYTRCSGCGGKVRVPCRLCETRQRIKRKGGK